MKLNTDGAFDKNGNWASAGGVLRDHNGEWKWGFSLKIGICDILSAEMWGLYQGLHLAREKGIRRLEVEVDNICMVQAVGSNTGTVDRHSPIVAEIKQLLQREWQVSIKHIYREINRVGDYLAKTAWQRQGRLQFFEEPPDGVIPFLQNDLNGALYSRRHIKAIITSEEVLLRDPSDEYVVPVVQELKRRLPPFNGTHQGHDYPGAQNDIEACDEDESPFQFRALEVALESICSFLAARTIELETAAYPTLDELTSQISSRNLDRVRKLKSVMTRLTAQVQKVRDVLEQLLDDDDDMADLYLSRKFAGSSPASGSGAANWYPTSPTIGSKISRASRASTITVLGDENNVEEFEMLLEAYFIQIDGTLNKLTTLREYIDDTEDYINIQLDNHRNQLIQLELFLSSGTVCLSIFSLVTGIFGVNIPYTWNHNHGYMFKWVIVFTGTCCATLFILIMSYARLKGLVGS